MRLRINVTPTKHTAARLTAAEDAIFDALEPANDDAPSWAVFIAQPDFHSGLLRPLVGRSVIAVWAWQISNRMCGGAIMALSDVKALAARRDGIALTPLEMDELRGFLADQYGIRKIPDGADVFASIRATCGDDVADEYEGLNDERADGSDAEYSRATK